MYIYENYKRLMSKKYSRFHDWFLEDVFQVLATVSVLLRYLDSIT